MSEEEKKAIKKILYIFPESEELKLLLNLIDKQQEEIEELKKYDYRNIKINKNNELFSIHFTKEQLDLMNLGIALYINIPKLLEENEENDDI